MRIDADLRYGDRDTCSLKGCQNCHAQELTPEYQPIFSRQSGIYSWTSDFNRRR